ncbi:MAG: ATP-binding protein [Flavisolibacter sp.]|jgi:uncharacterized protein (TIGR00290 family)|nr:ATP-binding protein [Flavisolibacter sp.]
MKAFLNWSGGKDAALCLHTLSGTGPRIDALVTTISNGRVSMHGVRKELIEKQAASIGVPVRFIELPDAPGMETYEHAIHEMNLQLKEEGFTHAVSGDIFLDDLKQYRETLYGKDGLSTLFPLWKAEPKELLDVFFEEGFKAIIVAVNGSHLPASCSGEMLDPVFINALPPGVDLCGENGEYHSFVFDGPVFTNPISFTKGATISKTYPFPGGEEKSGFKKAEKELTFYFTELLDEHFTFV